MDVLLRILWDNIQAYDWNSSLTIVLVALAALAFMRRWVMFLTLTATIVLGVGGANLIIMNASTAHQVVAVPTVVYAIGGIILAVGTLLAYIKFTLS